MGVMFLVLGVVLSGFVAFYYSRRIAHSMGDAKFREWAERRNYIVFEFDTLLLMTPQEGQALPAPRINTQDATQSAQNAAPINTPPAAPVLTPAWETSPFRQQILEISGARLDKISGNPELMKAYDLNGDGMVDGDEWEQLRQRVLEEIRVELSGEQPTPPADLNVPSQNVVNEPSVIKMVEAGLTREDKEDFNW